MRGASAAEDLDEGRAVFAFPAFAGLVQSPGIAVNQLLRDSFSSASLMMKQENGNEKYVLACWKFVMFTVYIDMSA